MGQSWPLFVYFCPFFNTTSIIQIEKSVDGVLGIRTRGRRMEGADKTMELWLPPNGLAFCWGPPCLSGLVCSFHAQGLNPDHSIYTFS